MKTKPKAPACPHCGRAGGVCWNMPCLVLSSYMEDGPDAVNIWLVAVDAPFRIEPKARDWHESTSYEA